MKNSSRMKLILSQVEHFASGRVVPEIAARVHYDFLQVLGNKAMSIRGLKLDDLLGIAVTAGSGLVDSLICGYYVCKGFFLCNEKAYHSGISLRISCFRALIRIKKFSFLVLSDGHCHFMLARDIDAYS
ncbi:hypothetical protein [Anaplasma phagocytophilum]|uniref:hypothetical protein n=1 Tax=Anaplasma phagocytophilum TaxID=948 RepID=UPI00200EE333|nr:hypothetical protein [Anaplasma phagocytophilum]UQD54461.1 hypothetical protein ESP60_03865 [Anaplasma phagocytophilum]